MTKLIGYLRLRRINRDLFCAKFRHHTLLPRYLERIQSHQRSNTCITFIWDIPLCVSCHLYMRHSTLCILSNLYETFHFVYLVTFIWDIPLCVSCHKYILLVFIYTQSHTTKAHFILQATSFGSNLGHRQALSNDKDTNSQTKL